MTLPEPSLGIDLLGLSGTREEVESGDHAQSLAMLKGLLRRDMCLHYRQRVLFGIDGYDDDPRDLYEIPEVRRWLIALDAEWPYWFFFLTPEKGSTLPLIAFSLCPYTVIPTGGKMIAPEDLAKFLERGFLAMNGISKWIGDSEQTNRQMTGRITAFFEQRRAPNGQHL